MFFLCCRIWRVDGVRETSNRGRAQSLQTIRGFGASFQPTASGQYDGNGELATASLGTNQ